MAPRESLPSNSVIVPGWSAIATCGLVPCRTDIDALEVSLPLERNHIQRLGKCASQEEAQ